jgi:hypothetical protein
MSTFKTINSNILPSKPSEIKRRSNNRKQIYATFNSNNNNNNNNTSSIITENETCSSAPPPPPPPFPVNLDLKSKNENQISFQSQIEQAKTRLKKVNNESSSPKKFDPSRKFLITFDFFFKIK